MKGSARQRVNAPRGEGRATKTKAETQGKKKLRLPRGLLND